MTGPCKWMVSLLIDGEDQDIEVVAYDAEEAEWIATDSAKAGDYTLAARPREVEVVALAFLERVAA